MTVSLTYNGVSVLNSSSTSFDTKLAFANAAAALNSGAEWQLTIGELIPYTTVPSLGAVIAFIGNQGVSLSDLDPWGSTASGLVSLVQAPQPGFSFLNRTILDAKGIRYVGANLIMTRPGDPTPGGNPYTGFVTNPNFLQDFLVPQLDVVTRFGGNVVRVLGGGFFTSFTNTTRQQHLTALTSLFNAIRSRNLYLYWSHIGQRGDNSDPNTFVSFYRGELPEVVATAALAASYDNLVAIDLIQEYRYSFLGVETGQGYTDDDSVTVAREYYTAVREVAPTTPLTLSLINSPDNTFNSFDLGITGRAQSNSLTQRLKPYCDFYDLHYYDDVSRGNIAASAASRAGKLTLLGEFGRPLSIGVPAMATFAQGVRGFNDDPAIVGSIWWAAADQADTQTQQVGCFGLLDDLATNERTAITSELAAFSKLNAPVGPKTGSVSVGTPSGVVIDQGGLVNIPLPITRSGGYVGGVFIKPTLPAGLSIVSVTGEGDPAANSLTLRLQANNVITGSPTVTVKAAGTAVPYGGVISFPVTVEVAAGAAPDTLAGLLSWYRGDNDANIGLSANSIWLSESGNNVLRVPSGPSFTKTGNSLNGKQALSFPLTCTTRVVDSVGATQINITSPDFQIGVLMNVSQWGSQVILLDGDGGTSRNPFISVTPTSIYCGSSEGTIGANIPFTFNVNTWYFIYAAITNTNYQFWVNSASIGAGANAAAGTFSGNATKLLGVGNDSVFRVAEAWTTSSGIPTTGTVSSLGQYLKRTSRWGASAF